MTRRCASELKHVQCDEIWSICYTKERNAPGAKTAQTFAGDVWTWISICADSKLICNWFVGGRDGKFAHIFMDDLAARLNHRVQMTTDGHKAYLNGIELITRCWSSCSAHHQTALRAATAPQSARV
jgi:hypothetical protein